MEKSTENWRNMSFISFLKLESLVDRVPNGGLAGNDVRVASKHQGRTAHSNRIENHEMISVPLVTAGILVLTIPGEVIIIMHKHSCHGKNKTIHSSPEIEYYKNIVDDRSIK